MAYQFDVNNLDGVNGGADVMFAFKEFLKANGYDVPESSDGVTYDAAGDQITHAGAGANGMNVSRAWFRLRAPAAMAPRREWCFMRGTGGEGAWWVKVSAEDGFVGGAPDATNMPTATDQQNLWGAAVAGSALFNAAATYRYHLMVQDASPFAWYIVCLVVATGVCATVLVFDPLVAGTAPIADDDPAVYLASWSFGNERMTVNVLGAVVAGAMAGWYGKDLAGETWQYYPALTMNDAGGNLVCPGWGTNKYTGYDEHFAIPYGRRAGIANPGWKGYGSVVRWLATVRANGDTLSTVLGVRTRLVVGQCVVPWPDVVPII